MPPRWPAAPAVFTLKGVTPFYARWDKIGTLIEQRLLMTKGNL